MPHERRVEQYGSFHAFAQALGPPRPYAAKFGIPMFSPAEWPPGVKKTLDGVLRVHFGVLDYDDVPLGDLVQLLARIDVPYVFCSSWSHGDPYKTRLALERMEERGAGRAEAIDRLLAGWDGPPNEPPRLVRGRLILPFSRPVEIGEWKRVWSALASRYSHGRATVDRACSDASHCYFVPAHPQNPPAEPLYVDQSLGRHLWGGLVQGGGQAGPQGASCS